MNDTEQNTWQLPTSSGPLTFSLVPFLLSSATSCPCIHTTLPVVGPIFFAAQLLANLVVFWIVLGLEAFSREMQIGTYVIVVSVVLLIVNGPESQNYGDTTFQQLISQLYALIWACLLTGAMLVCGFIVTFVDLQHTKRKWWFKYVVLLLLAGGTAFALNLSTGKALVLPTNRFWLAINIVVKIVSGMIYTRAILVQSTAVEQKVFVPINAAFIVLINALTGIIIWEDGKVVSSWVGYACVFLLLALGCGLLLGDLGLLQESSPETFLGARASMVYRENREDMLDRLQHFGKHAEWEPQLASFLEEPERPPSTILRHNRHNSEPFTYGAPSSTNQSSNHNNFLDDSARSSSNRSNTMTRRTTTQLSNPADRPLGIQPLRRRPRGVHIFIRNQTGCPFQLLLFRAPQGLLV